jgi:hypothetical protein
MPIFLDNSTAMYPHSVALCNGVRAKGRLDAGKLRVFFDAVSPNDPRRSTP